MAINTDTNNDALRAAWKSVTSRDDDTWWCVYEMQGKDLAVKATGNDGFSGLVNQLDDNSVLWGAFLVKGVDDRGSTVSVRDKFVGFTWIGESVSVLKKARVSVQKRDVFRLLDGCGMNIEIMDKESFTPKYILQVLLKSGGAHKPTYYQFGPNEEDKLNLDFYEGGDQ
mmetsp:Transcript_23929/g.67026  ORF Transcript_23929/g.67026 Transcript_23929/m.67026 type:complete len:169 (-) Transcript_23929:48-554(-)|eukprot:CAMPEP_0119118322 /NCGR_PEP_ID=MMETSP1310-20130426/215_1 /TAXON_ID=464262 /ORGANISM="Genus nov. species nov., Strain RCC2339" /LENGTH=168 /DNA_ID=CAMNT_0007107669 /DNA_START=88 /DNA_END=594 /DNA_ORIENTATION=-